MSGYPPSKASTFIAWIRNRWYCWRNGHTDVAYSIGPGEHYLQCQVCGRRKENPNQPIERRLP